MSIINTYEKILKIVEKNNLTKQNEVIRSELNLGSPAEWKKHLEEIQQEGRFLRIGIVGRVKAGKSSLLNALLFDGRDVLPKAATPMTAALTMIKYADSISAEVEFFSQSDIDDFRGKYEAYQDEFKKRENAALEEQKARDPEKVAAPEKARKKAEREMKNSSLAAYYDQYKRIHNILKSNPSYESNLGKTKELKADSYDKLMDELQQYVGAEGKFMPLTKSVTLSIPEESLQGLEIIDTPGLNDPVQSRSMRTENELAKCDAVLVISPAGQFLSQNDTELLDKLVNVQGTQEIYLIASQSDNQLYGQEYNDDYPSQTYQQIVDTLTASRNRILEGSDIPNTIVEKMNKHPVLCVSSMGYSLLKNINKPDENWNSGEKTLYGNLMMKFPLLSSREILREQLNKIANIDVVQGIIKDLRERKTEILKDSLQKFETSKKNLLEKYRDKWIEEIETEIKEIEKGDIEEAKQELQNLQQKTAQIEDEIGDIYDDYIYEYTSDLKNILRVKTEQIKSQLETGVNNEEKTNTKTVTVKDESSLMNLFGLLAGTHTETRTTTKINAGRVRHLMQHFISMLEEELNDIIEAKRIEFKRKINKGVTNKMVNIIDGHELQPDKIRRSLNNIIALIPDRPFTIRKDIPISINQSGTITGSDVERFLDKLFDYTGKLFNNVSENRIIYTNEIGNRLKEYDLAKKLTEDLSGNLEQLIKDIENKEFTVYQKNKILNSFKDVLGDN